ncbi:Hypothetical protein CINCED_3A020220 [Cinara cedri]|uniref:Uncharacterized protein n=1 Tax=Cinara cedri TaxID=506608 RepID=A0A5E4NSN2_9HEMI|nr:Hypothetical protein CINCED_3A020220 [Cinara cedri]
MVTSPLVYQIGATSATGNTITREQSEHSRQVGTGSVKSETIDIWQREWETAGKGRWANNNKYSTLNHRLKGNTMNYYLTSDTIAITGHGGFLFLPASLPGRAVSPKCVVCGYDNDDAEHCFGI